MHVSAKKLENKVTIYNIGNCQIFCKLVTIKIYIYTAGHSDTFPFLSVQWCS